MSKKCSSCGLFNPASAQRCDCGYDFQAGKLPGSASESMPAEPKLERLAVAALAIPLFISVAIVVAESVVWQAEAVALSTAGGALIAAVLVPGLLVARFTRLNRFTYGCKVALVGWSVQLVTTTFVAGAVTQDYLNAAQAAFFLWLFGIVAGLLTAGIAVLAGKIGDKRIAV